MREMEATEGRAANNERGERHPHALQHSWRLTVQERLTSINVQLWPAKPHLDMRDEQTRDEHEQIWSG